MNDHPDDERAEQLLTVALALADDMRADLDKAHRMVRHLDRCDLEALTCVLAALVPHDAPPSNLAWWRYPLVRDSAVEPCGTWSAASRHRKHGEELDPLCRAAAGGYRQGIRARDRRVKDGNLPDRTTMFTAKAAS